jgi:hypothetical protein
MSTVISIRFTDEDVRGICADNDIPETEWPALIERVQGWASAITDTVTNLINTQVEGVILDGQP